MVAAAVLAGGAVLGIVPAAPAAAEPDPVPVTFTVSTSQAHPGDTVTITATFADPDGADVAFSYLSLNPHFVTWFDGPTYSFTSCTGDITWCELRGDDHTALALHHAAPIPGGQTRTATFTYTIATDSSCGPLEEASFFFYSYRETAAGGTDAVVPGPSTIVVC
ncbi:MAG TPA: hypothetical protein VIL36_04090 [Acidimicrobiales bacterium]